MDPLANPFAPPTSEESLAIKPARKYEIEPHKIGFGETISRAISVAFSNYITIMIAVFVSGLLAAIGAGIAGGVWLLARDALREQSVIIVTIYIPAAILQFWLALGLIKFSISVARNESNRFSDLFPSASQLFRTMRAAFIVLLFYLLVLVMGAILFWLNWSGKFDMRGVTTYGSLLVLFTAGLTVLVSQSPALIVDRNYQPRQSLKTSRELMKSNALTVLAIYGVSVVILGIVTIGLRVVAEPIVGDNQQLINLLAFATDFLVVLLFGPYFFALYGVIYLGVTGQLLRSSNDG